MRLAWLLCSMLACGRTSDPPGRSPTDGVGPTGPPTGSSTIPDPPAVDAIAIDAPAAGIRDLRCATTVRDGAVEAVSWEVDGRPSDVQGDAIPAGDLAIGEVWTCTATATGPGGSATATSAPFTVPAPPGGNVLLVLLDDVGTDKLASYHMEAPPAHTPTLDALAAEGVQFQQAWATPACSTTRALLLTGRYGRRTGVMHSLSEVDDPFELPEGEITIPEMLGDARTGVSWDSLAIGKWHLSTLGTFHKGTVEDQGFHTFQGVKATLGPRGDYFEWEQVWADQTTSLRTGYATTAQIDDTLALLPTLAEPWFTYLSLSAAHAPLHVPPADLQGTGVVEGSPDADLYDATLEAADTELGRLLASLDPALRARTTIVVVGDNGTPDYGIRPPLDPDRSKLSVYEAGVRVPLIVTGPLVASPGRVEEGLVGIEDLFATIADIAGVPLTGPADALALPAPDGTATPIDGVSLLPVLLAPGAPTGRSLLYVESGSPVGPPPWEISDSAVRDATFKFARGGTGEERLYRIGDQLDEGPDLIAAGPLDADAAEALARLRGELDRIDAATPYAW